MREEMIATLAKFFNEHGLMDRTEYRNNTSVPYTWREIQKEFKTYAVMLNEVSQHKLPEVQVSEPVQPPVVTKPVKRQFKRAKGDSLDE